MSQLTVYKASAGSGKTFKLTEEYLKLLFKNPLLYRNILAVTFTNKATEEMKSRIISELNNLINNVDTPFKRIVQAKYKINDDKLLEKAKEILGRILHDYSRFSVGTIDSFFQGIIQAFTREIGLQVGFNIEMDQYAVLDEAIGRLMFDLDQDTNLRDWLVSFAENKIIEGKSWNFKNDIVTLGYELFKENFKTFKGQIIEKISDKVFLEDYNFILRKIQIDFKKSLTKIGLKALVIIKNHNLEISDFSYGKVV